LFGHYQLKESDYKFIHLYLPFWNLDEIVEEQNFLFVRKGETYFGIFFSNPSVRIFESSVYGREVRATGEDQFIIIKVSSNKEYNNFSIFMDSFKNKNIKLENDILSYSDKQYGQFEYIADNLVLNGAPVLYEQKYNIFIKEEEL
jgi:hypothetical protein